MSLPRIILWILFGTLCVELDGLADVFTMEQKPEIVRKKYGTILEFHRNGAQFPITCFLPERPGSSVHLDTNTVYKFTVSDGGGWDQELLKIETGNVVVFDASKCEVHGTKMEFKRVPIVYGLLRSPNNSAPFESFAKLKKAKFPHYREFIGGGCTVDSQSATYSHAWLCKDCKAAFEKWEAQQNDRRP